MIVETDDDTFTIDKGPPLTLTCSKGQLVISTRPVVEAFNSISKNWFDSHPEIPLKERKLQAWLETGLIDWLPLVSNDTHNLLRQEISNVAWSESKEVSNNVKEISMIVFEKRINKHSLPAIATVQVKGTEWSVPKEVELEWCDSVNSDNEPGLRVNGSQSGYAGFDNGVYKTFDYREETNTEKQMRIVHSEKQQPLRNTKQENSFDKKSNDVMYLVSIDTVNQCVCSTRDIAEKNVREYFDGSDIDVGFYITEIPVMKPPVKKILKKIKTPTTTPVQTPTPTPDQTPTPTPVETPVVQTESTECPHIIVRGAQKGQKCGKPGNPYCRSHSRSKKVKNGTIN